MYYPKRALKIDRARKHHRETKKIDQTEMSDYDLDDAPPNRRNTKHNQEE